MRNRLISLGIGLNMFFQDFYDISEPNVMQLSWSYMLKERVRLNTWIDQRIKDGTIEQYINE